MLIVPKAQPLIADWRLWRPIRRIRDNIAWMADHLRTASGHLVYNGGHLVYNCPAGTACSNCDDGAGGAGGTVADNITATIPANVFGTNVSCTNNATCAATVPAGGYVLTRTSNHAICRWTYPRFTGCVNGVPELENIDIQLDLTAGYVWQFTITQSGTLSGSHSEQWTVNATLSGGRAVCSSQTITAAYAGSNTGGIWCNVLGSPTISLSW